MIIMLLDIFPVIIKLYMKFQYVPVDKSNIFENIRHISNFSIRGSFKAR